MKLIYVMDDDKDFCNFKWSGRCEFDLGKLCESDLNNRPAFCPLKEVTHHWTAAKYELYQVEVKNDQK